jgi:hypothetical protein
MYGRCYLSASQASAGSASENRLFTCFLGRWVRLPALAGQTTLGRFLGGFLGLWVVEATHLLPRTSVVKLLRVSSPLFLRTE